MTYTPQKAAAPPGLVSTVVKAGLLAGTLDILLAFLQYYIKTGKSPLIVLKFIASAIYGKTAFTGGAPMAALGLSLHYLIAFCWTILFFLLYPSGKRLFKNPFLLAFVYGIVVWLVMNLVILPFTNIPRPVFKWAPALTGAFILVIAIGLPLSIIARAYYSNKPDPVR
jgi:hypothetical protein